MVVTVGIVLVSHSPAIAEGTAALAGQIGGGTVPIAAAGGTDDGRLGTSVAKVETAIRAASGGGGGVLILPDLGSSVLTVRTLLADLEDEPRDEPYGDIEMADAPFVEGAVAAAVIAAAGGTLKAVLEAAQEARNVPKL